MSARARLGLAMAVVAVAAIVLATTSPIRRVSSDTLPGRMGAAVMRCAGTFDLRRIDWVQHAADQNSTYYFMYPDKTGEYTSVFGPAPAVAGTLALLDFGKGDRMTDADLRRRERFTAAALVALAASLLVLAAGARSSPLRAGLTGLVAVASYAGAATLGQGLWQATTALPPLTGALALLAWRERSPRLSVLAAVAAPALLVLAAMLRPTIAPLCGGLGLVWLLHARPRTRRGWIVAIALVLATSAALVAWNAIHLHTPFPVAQWHANRRMTQGTGSVFSVGHVATGIAGLLASPARGLVWFAPIIIVGVVLAMRRHATAPAHPWRYAAVGILLQLVAMALFFKWHGGQAYGPRLLAEATWVAAFLALGAGIEARAANSATPSPSTATRYLGTIAAVVTCAVGLAGLYRWRPEQWESRRAPEAHTAAFWDFVDSPISSMFVDHGPRPPAYDAPPVRGYECRKDGTLHSYY